MARQREFFDVSVVAESRNQTYERLAALAHESVGVDAQEVMGLLRISEKPGADGGLNTGNQVCLDKERGGERRADAWCRLRMI